MNENEVAKMVVDAAYHIHVAMGPGLLESAYEKILAYELTKRGLDVRRQVRLPVKYDGHEFDEAFVIDLFVDDPVIIELKSTDETHPVHRKQLLTYLKLADKRLGLLLNFGKVRIKHGIERVVHELA
jgi:GxxExxY protein